MAEPFPAEGLALEEARRRVLEAITAIQASRPHHRPDHRASAHERSSGPGQRRTDHGQLEAVPGFRASIMDGYAIADELPPQSDAHWQLVGRSAPGAPFDGFWRPVRRSGS
jgi:molybdopterin molybdotransferase